VTVVVFDSLFNFKTVKKIENNCKLDRRKKLMHYDCLHILMACWRRCPRQELYVSSAIIL